jgi:predicted deacylase
MIMRYRQPHGSANLFAMAEQAGRLIALTHPRRVRQGWQVHSVAEAVSRALQNGLV